MTNAYAADPILHKEITIHVSERPDGIERLLTAIEERKLYGRGYNDPNASEYGCSYWHIANRDEVEAMRLEAEMSTRLGLDDGRLKDLPPLADAVAHIGPHEFIDQPYQGLKDLYDVIVHVRDEVTSGRVASGLYDTQEEGGPHA